MKATLLTESLRGEGLGSLRSVVCQRQPKSGSGTDFVIRGPGELGGGAVNRPGFVAGFRLWLSRPGARCRDCSRSVSQAARRTRRAPLDATGSPRCLPLGVVGHDPGVGDLYAAVPVSRDRYLGEVE